MLSDQIERGAVAHIWPDKGSKSQAPKMLDQMEVEARGIGMVYDVTAGNKATLNQTLG